MVAREGRKAAIMLGNDSVGTIVAALRLFQRTYQYRDNEAISEDFPEIFTADHLGFGVVLEPAPLRTDNIDDLCEQLIGLDALELKLVE